MHPIDLLIVGLFFAGMIGFGYWLKDRQESVETYFVGDRAMGAGHVGFSVVATDVGGGFSIGLGGLGYAVGLAGSWLLFTGLLGAWLAAVFLIPRVKPLGDAHGFLTFPDLLARRFGERTRVLAAVVSALGYAGFVGSQLLAGGKLSASAFDLPLPLAVLGMALVVVLYTALGGIKAVILTDTVQWGILLGGLALVALPLGYSAVGGIEGLQRSLPPGHLDLFNISPGTFLTWLVTIVPIWFVGMTLYQRIYAARDVRTAQRAWYLAGLLEWPCMAFLGVILGMFSRVLFPEVEAEMGLPMLIRSILPIGATGLVLAAYFAAIMSTADSCLLASVGNVVSDLYHRFVDPLASQARLVNLARVLILAIGMGSVGFALYFPKVIDSIIVAYSFMVAGLFFPTLAALYWPRATAAGAFWSILLGGGVTVLGVFVPGLLGGVEPIFVGLPVSALAIVAVSLVGKAPVPDAAARAAEARVGC